jgi:hypothetical protein
LMRTTGEAFFEMGEGTAVLRMVGLVFGGLESRFVEVLES